MDSALPYSYNLSGIRRAYIKYANTPTHTIPTMIYSALIVFLPLQPIQPGHIPHSQCEERDRYAYTKGVKHCQPSSKKRREQTDDLPNIGILPSSP
jgi:membrane carboxypeptidase/penicillin-binding protein PbpC